MEMLRIYTGGTFDLLHPGHVEFLKYCSELGFLTVALNTDEFVASYKGIYPVQSYAERMFMLLNITCVNEVIPNKGGVDSKATIESMLNQPHIVAIGSDWYENEKDYLDQMGFTWEWLYKKKISLMFVPRFTKYSTTDLKKRIVNDSLNNSLSKISSERA